MELYEKYPSAARSQLRSDLLMPTTFVGLGGIFLGGTAVVTGDGLWRVGGLVTGLALIYLAYCLWQLRVWARWTLVLGIGGILVTSIAKRLLMWEFPGRVDLIVMVIGALFWGGLLAYLASSGVSRMFVLANSEWEPRAGHTGTDTGAPTGSEIEANVSSPR